jgi:hypothetical protein
MEVSQVAISITQIEDELQSCKQDLEKARDRRKQAQSDEQTMERKYDALSTLFALMNGNGAMLPQQSAAEMLETPKPETTDSSGENTNKTALILELVVKSGQTGITAVDIWKKLQADSVKMHRNYLYAVLDRLIEQDKIVERRGKYYRKEPVDKASE